MAEVPLLTVQIASDGLHRTVCDYLSGMTDRYLIEEHARLFAACS